MVNRFGPWAAIALILAACSSASPPALPTQSAGQGRPTTVPATRAPASQAPPTSAPAGPTATQGSYLASGSLLYVGAGPAATDSEALGTADLWQIEPDSAGTAPVRLTGCNLLNCMVQSFALAPAGAQIAYVVSDLASQRRSLRLRDLASGSETVLVADADDIFQPVFAPDSSQLAYLIANNSTSAPVPISQLTIIKVADKSVAQVGKPAAFIEDLAWTPTGTSLLYSRALSGTPPTKWNIYQQPLAEGPEQVMVNGARLLAQSAAGDRWLVQIEITSENYGLGIYDPAKDELARFELNGWNVLAADWKPDGMVAAVVSQLITYPGPNKTSNQVELVVFPDTAGSIPAEIDSAVEQPIKVQWLGSTNQLAVVAVGGISLAEATPDQTNVDVINQVVPIMSMGLPLFGSVP